MSRCRGSNFSNMDTGQRSKASGSTVWLVYAQVFFVISQACENPETPQCSEKTSLQHSITPHNEQSRPARNTPETLQCSEKTSSQHSRQPTMNREDQFTTLQKPHNEQRRPAHNTPETPQCSEKTSSQHSRNPTVFRDQLATLQNTPQ